MSPCVGQKCNSESKEIGYLLIFSLVWNNFTRLNGESVDVEGVSGPKKRVIRNYDAVLHDKKGS